ncbi:hypothetical protein AAMO2058_001505200 [Amorphochlora amoebiformis]
MAAEDSSHGSLTLVFSLSILMLTFSAKLFYPSPMIPLRTKINPSALRTRALRGSTNVRFLFSKRRGFPKPNRIKYPFPTHYSTTPKAESSPQDTSDPHPGLTPLRTGKGVSQRVVVLGGGFGGLYAALKLSELKWDTRPEITLVDVADRFLFKPLMYELITGEATIDQVAPLFRDVIGTSGIRFVQDEVKAVAYTDPGANLAGRVTLGENTSLEFDYLVSAVGAQANLDLAEGAKEYALPFVTLDDVRNLETHLSRLEFGLRNTSIPTKSGVGGVELAAAVSDRLCETIGPENTAVTLYVAGSSILQSFASDARQVAERDLKAKNIQVKYNQRVGKIGKESDETYSLEISGDSSQNEVVNADIVLWTAGARPVDLTGAQGKVDETLRILEHSREFAIGDVAGISSLPATAQVAMQQADYVAWNIFADVNGEQLLKFRYQHLGNMMTLGPLSAAATLNIPGVGDLTLKGPVASGLRKLAYIYRMPTTQQRLKVGSEWLRNPDLWVPKGLEIPRDIKDAEKLNEALNPFVNLPKLERLLDDQGREEVKGALKGLFDRFTAEVGAAGMRGPKGPSNKKV